MIAPLRGRRPRGGPRGGTGEGKQVVAPWSQHGAPAAGRTASPRCHWGCLLRKGRIAATAATHIEQAAQDVEAMLHGAFTKQDFGRCPGRLVHRPRLGFPTL